LFTNSHYQEIQRAVFYRHSKSTQESNMSDINLTDVTIHIDKATDADTRDKIEAALRHLNGVVGVRMSSDEPHLVLVEYNPDVTTSTHMLTTVRELAGHAEMIGL
jgi:cell division protein FtsX